MRSCPTKKSGAGTHDELLRTSAREARLYIAYFSRQVFFFTGHIPQVRVQVTVLPINKQDQILSLIEGPWFT